MPNPRQGFQFLGNSAPLGGPLTPPRRPGAAIPTPGNLNGQASDFMGSRDFVYLYRQGQQAFFQLVANTGTLILEDPDDTRIGFIIRNARNSGAVVGLGFNIIPNSSELCFAELGPGEAVNATEFGWIPQNRVYAWAAGGTANLIVISSDVKLGG